MYQLRRNGARYRPHKLIPRTLELPPFDVIEGRFDCVTELSRYELGRSSLELMLTIVGLFHPQLDAEARNDIPNKIAQVLA